MAESFEERLARARAVGLSPSFAKVARYIEANVRRPPTALRTGAALSTARALAREVGLYPETIRRFALRLGYRGWPELREELAAAVLEETDVTTGTGLVPRLLRRRQALEEQRGTLREAIESLDAEIEWVDRTIERCEVQGQQERRQ